MSAEHLLWLGQSPCPEAKVGPRAAALARLAALLPVPKGFVLPRASWQEFIQSLSTSETGGPVVAKLPGSIPADLAGGLGKLQGSAAVRRSPIDSESVDELSGPDPRGGRPERETYLNLIDIADVTEAVRRIWSGGTSSPRNAILTPTAVVIQRFLAADLSAIVRRDSAESSVLHVLSTYGVGDLLASGLVVADKHAIRRSDGAVVASTLGRKAQMSVARGDGGLARVPVPVARTRQMALGAEHLVLAAETFRRAEEVIGSVRALALAFAGGRWFVTTVDQ